LVHPFNTYAEAAPSHASGAGERSDIVSFLSSNLSFFVQQQQQQQKKKNHLFQQLRRLLLPPLPAHITSAQ
jgi:hypothetical protein